MKKTTLFFVLISFCLCLFSQKVVTDSDIYLPGECVSFRVLSDNKTPIKNWEVTCFDSNEKIIFSKYILFPDNSLSFSLDLPWDIQQGEYRLTFKNSATEQTISAHIFVLFPKNNKIQLQCDIDSLISLKSNLLKFSLLLKSDVNENIKVSYKIIRDNKVIKKAKSKIIINKPAQFTIAGVEFLKGDLLSFSYSFQKKKYYDIIPIKFIDSKSDVTFAVEGETLIENETNKVGFLSVGSDLKPVKRNFKLMNSNNEQLVTFENVAAANFEFIPLPNTTYFLVDQYGNKYDLLNNYLSFFNKMHEQNDSHIKLNFSKNEKSIIIDKVQKDSSNINCSVNLVRHNRVLPFINWNRISLNFVFNNKVLELLNKYDNMDLGDLQVILCKYYKESKKFLSYSDYDIYNLLNAEYFYNLNYNNGASEIPKVKSKEAYLVALEQGTSVINVISMIKSYTLMGDKIIFPGGLNSINSQEGALIVIDGIKMGSSSSALSRVNPNDITKIFISTNISDIQKYSSFNSVGLIDITTKKGGLTKEEKLLDGFVNSDKKLNTLLWLPNFDMTKTAKVAIGEQNQKGQFVIRVTGIDSNSNIYYATRKIKID